MGFEWDVRKAEANYRKQAFFAFQSRCRYLKTMTPSPSPTKTPIRMRCVSFRSEWERRSGFWWWFIATAG